MSDNDDGFVYQLRTHTQVRVYQSIYRGRNYLHVREWFREDEDSDYKPGKGIAIPEDKARLFCEGMVTFLAQWLDEHETPPTPKPARGARRCS